MSGGFSIHASALRAAIVAVAFVGAGLSARTAHADAAEAKKIFNTRCTACHTFGKGVKVGPDLKGVTERRQRAWLLKFVRTSSKVIESGDPIATELFTQFKQQRMPDWIDLSEEQVNSILDWLGVNGPDQLDPDAKAAELATAAEIDIGRQLFHGERKLTRGGTACGSCHSIRDASGSSGGTLAFELTDIYSGYQDVAMTQFLKHPCTDRLPESQGPAFLAPDEAYALKAYMRHCALTNQSGSSSKPTIVGAKPVDGTNNTPTPGSAAGTQAPAAAKRVAWAPRAAAMITRATRGSRLEGDLLFLAFPYAALLVLIAGIGLRFAMSRRDPEATRAGARSAWELFSGTTTWRIGLAVTFGLHLLGLLIPRSILAWNGVPVRLYLLEDGGFLLGVVALVGWVKIMRRHINKTTASARATLQEIADCGLLSLFCMALVSGLVIAILYRWGSSWSASTLAPYMQSLASGAPQTQLVEDLPFLVRLHVLSWFAIIALVPFTSASLIAVSLLDRAVALVVRPIDAATAMGRRTMAKLSPAKWLWPEEDAVDLTAKVDNAQEHS
ncbi:MAG TPA: respiratory nitrate reductase subunit gamma [Kofleriaceae bacterium]|nr:respiratory nitrate reductase subunit gamma [Kofleriaceae bacterium]